MAFTLRVHVSAGSSNTTSVTTASIDTSVNSVNLIVIACGWYTGTITVSDSKTNTWSSLTSKFNGTNHIGLYYCYAPTVDAAHTFTASSGGAMYPSICVLTFSGSASSPFDVENGSNGSAGTTQQPGSITPSVDNELIITALAGSGAYGGTPTIDSSFVSPATESVDYLAGNHFGSSIAYQIQTTATARNPTWAWTNSATNPCVIASFKATGGGSFNPSWATGANKLVGEGIHV